MQAVIWKVTGPHMHMFLKGTRADIDSVTQFTSQAACTHFVEPHLETEMVHFHVTSLQDKETRGGQARFQKQSITHSLNGGGYGLGSLVAHY